jgi:Family of unknown function (DUF6152)
MRIALTLALTGANLFLLATSGWAHHAFAAEFDQAKPIKLKGTVTKWELINPHSWIHLDVKGPDGSTVNWMIEGGSPNSLFRQGFTKDSLPPGTEILVDGYQSKDGSSRAVGKDLTFPDGRRLFLGGSVPGGNPDRNDEPEKK